jgi:hypothetical protein
MTPRALFRRYMIGSSAPANAAAAAAAATRIAAAVTDAPTGYGPAAYAADAADAAVIERGGRPQTRAALATNLASAPLWPDEMPTGVAAAWSKLKAVLIAADEGWEVWIEWYEDRLAGRPSLSPEIDIAIATLPDALWDRGPQAVNAHVRQLIDAARPSPEVIGPIPPQGAGPHFGLRNNGKIGLVPPSEIDAVGNNISRIRQLLPQVRRNTELLAAHLGSTNAYPELAADVAEYRAAISRAPEAIAWGTVFGLGIMLDNAAAAAQRTVDDRMSPALEDTAKAALDSMLRLHDLLILATAEGRELADEADRMRLTRDEQAALRQDAQIVAGRLQKASDIIEPTAAKLMEQATDAIGEGRHPERGSVFGMTTVKHVATILLPAAMLGAVDAVAAHFGGGEVGTAIGETAAVAGAFALAENDRIRGAARALGSDFERLFEVDRATVVQRLGRLAPFHRFVRANDEPLRRIAANTSQLHWMVPYIDFVARSNEAKSDPLLPLRSP